MAGMIHGIITILHTVTIILITTIPITIIIMDIKQEIIT